MELLAIGLEALQVIAIQVAAITAVFAGGFGIPILVIILTSVGPDPHAIIDTRESKFSVKPTLS